MFDVVIIVDNIRNMETKEILTKIGLSADEVAVYLSCLELGDSTVQKIAQSSGVKRTTVYLVAKSLMEKGLMGQYETRIGLRLSAQRPELLLSQLEERAKEVATIIPQLKALEKKEAYRPQVKYFEGKEGYFTVCEDTLQKHLSELLWLGDPTEIYKIIGEKYDNEYYIPTRLKRKINLRALLVKNPLSEKLKGQKNDVLMREVRFLPAHLPFHSTQFIYENKVASISSTKELVSILTESKDLAEMERAKFELLWQKSA